jgi:EAL domain-containing protein (putative c-di-GMP-specific phosphodiesterase class I)
MYSPRIKKDLIPYLYRIKKEQGIPMTKLVNEIIESYLTNIKKEEDSRNVIKEQASSKAF